MSDLLISQVDNIIVIKPRVEENSTVTQFLSHNKHLVYRPFYTFSVRIAALFNFYLNSSGSSVS